MLHRIYCLPIEDTVLIALFVCLAWTLTGGVLWSRAPWGRRLWRAGCGVLAAVWLCVVLYTTLLSRAPGVYEAHLVPLFQLRQALFCGKRELLRSAWMNVLLFIPGGLTVPELLPLGWTPRRRVWLGLLTLGLLSVGIELLQFHWSLGQAETDDCLANTLGATLGLLVFRLRMWTAACESHKNAGLLDRQ